MNTRKKIILSVLAIVLIIIAGTWLFLRKSGNDQLITLYGNVDIREVSLAFNGTDRIQHLAVQEGDHVKAGQILGTLDQRNLNHQIANAEAQLESKKQILLRLKNGSRPEEIAQARANVASAQADAENARMQLDRLVSANREAGDQAVSQSDIDAAVSKKKMTFAQLDNLQKALRLALIGPRKEDIAQAQADADSAKAALDLLRYNLEETRLKAPLDAVVRNRLLEQGDMASPQRPVFVLAISNPKWVRAYIKESDLSRIKPGMTAKVNTDSHPDKTIPGRIGFISSVAEFTPKTVQTEELRTSLVYEVRIFVDDPDDQLRLGMPATVNISLQNNPENTAKEPS